LSQLHIWNTDEIGIINSKKIGSLLNSSIEIKGNDGTTIAGADLMNHFQNLALETRLKIPLIIGRDVIHGFRTIFPIPLAQAASFNPDLAERTASAAALEASASGYKWTFAPMLDIARDPRWGRVAEGNGEDPFLGGRMAERLVRGYQGDNPASPDKSLPEALVGYGLAEGSRDYENGEISEATLRDIYLHPFESCAQALEQSYHFLIEWHQQQPIAAC
jgi:beta-glucosidase